MITKRPGIKQKKSFLLLLLLAASLNGCVSIPNTAVCAVAGKLSAGGICAETLTDRTLDLNFEQFIEFLEAQLERPDPDHPGQTLPARGAAICQSSNDYGKNHAALEEACRLLGPQCSYEIKTALARMRVEDRLFRALSERRP